ncbi:MAG: hypothetical protein Q9193_003292 [Seirophora villosa]
MSPSPRFCTCATTANLAVSHTGATTSKVFQTARLDESTANGQGLSTKPVSLPYSAESGGDDITLPDDETPKEPARESGYFYKRANLYSRDSLGITTLGRPAEVLRVQDAPLRSFERKWWIFQNKGGESLDPTEPLTSLDILEKVNSERGLVSAARAQKNVEALKQDWLAGRKDPDSPPSESECDELRRTVHDGFTTKQLLGYYNEILVTVSTDLTDLSTPFRSSLLTRSEWRAGTTSFPGDTVQGVQHHPTVSRSQGSTPRTLSTEHMLSYEGRHSKDSFKYILVNKILRQCWNIRSREELESLGEVNLWMAEAHFELVTTHAREVLRQIAEEYDAKIDFSKVEPLLRITATPTSCVSTLKLLSMMLGKIECLVMRLEKQDISKSRTKDYRTLLNDQLLREAERISGTVMRWPKRKVATKASGETVLKDLERHIQPSFSSAKIGTSQQSSGFWWTAPNQELSAVIGRILYPTKSAPSEKSPESFLAEISSQRTLFTDLPSIRRTVENREFKMTINNELYIRLSAASEPTTEDSGSAILPDLELRFNTFLDESRGMHTVAFKGVRLILENKQADLLLPHEQADLRFEMQKYVTGKEEPDPRILEFVKSSNLVATAVDEIETPQVLTLSIPQGILYPGQQQTNDAENSIDYSPTIIERRCTLQHRPGLQSRNLQADLSFSSVDAGLIGGRRQEIRYFDDRRMKNNPELVMKEAEKQAKDSTVKALFRSAIGMIRSLGIESEGHHGPHSKRSSRRMGRVSQGHQGTAIGQKMPAKHFVARVPRGVEARRLDRNTVVRRQVTDGDRSHTERVSQPAPLRKVRPRNQTGW